MDGYRIDRLPEGGFVVTRIGSEQNMMGVCVFASSRIDQALGYLRDKLDPAQIRKQPPQAIPDEAAELPADVLGRKSCPDCGTPEAYTCPMRVCTARK